MAWQNMQLDPLKYQELKKTAFTLTYLNHALLSYLSALGAHRNQHTKQTLNMLVFENHILKALDEASEWLTTQNNNKIENIESSLEEISTQLLITNNEATQIQYILLHNIAEVTLQILEQAKLFKQTENNS